MQQSRTRYFVVAIAAGLLALLVISFSLTTTVVTAQFATNTPHATVPALATLTDASTATATLVPTLTLTPSPVASETPSATPTTIGPVSYPTGFNPLTGLPYPDEEAMARRNLIVKISNYPPLVRPQYGVNSADVVYEYEAEGGVTRFAAIFRSNTPSRVGSIRSARLVDMELTTMYRALLAYSGTSEPIQRLLTSAPFFEYQIISPLIGDNCDTAGFCRVDLGPDVPFEHTLFADTSMIWGAATRRNTNTGYIARGFAFDDTPSPSERIANDIFVDWYGQTDARWQYDEDTEEYLRFTDSVPHYDASDDSQLWADNVVIIEVPHVKRPDLFPVDSNYQSIGIELWDQGRAFVFRQGRVYQGFWRRQNREPGSALQLIFGDNTPIMLKPGRTWVSIVRGFGDVIMSEDRADMPATATALAMTPSPTPYDLNTDS